MEFCLLSFIEAGSARYLNCRIRIGIEINGDMRHCFLLGIRSQQ
jgi:hypothetical protein